MRHSSVSRLVGRPRLPINEDFMASPARARIWNEATAWYYGWMLSDGCISERCGRKYTNIQLALKRGDRDVIEKVRALLQSGHRICDIENKVGYQYSSLNFSSDVFAGDLARLGIVPRKSKITYLHDSLFDAANRGVRKHALRGLLEGDGSIHAQKSKNGTGRLDWTVTFSGTHAVVTAVQEITNTYLSNDSTIRTSAKGNLRLIAGETWALQYGGNRVAPAICKWLYDGADPGCVMNRKALLAARAIAAYRV